MDIKFKTLQVIIDNNRPDKSLLQAIDKSINKNYKTGSISYVFKTDYNEEEQFLWIYAQYENYKIRNRYVYDKDTYSSEENPRKNNQIEYKHQFFALYYLKNNTLYLSNLQKKEQLSNYLEEVLQKDVVLKNFYKSINDFSKGLTRLKDIAFVTKWDLFKKPNGIFDTISDSFGLDATEQLYIKADYGGKTMVDVGKKLINKIKKQSDDKQIESVVVCGYDDNDIERSLDVNNYVESIVVYVEPETDSYLYNDVDVRNALICELRRLNV